MGWGGSNLEEALFYLKYCLNIWQSERDFERIFFSTQSQFLIVDDDQDVDHLGGFVLILHANMNDFNILLRAFDC